MKYTYTSKYTCLSLSLSLLKFTSCTRNYHISGRFSTQNSMFAAGRTPKPRDFASGILSSFPAWCDHTRTQIFIESWFWTMQRCARR